MTPSPAIFEDATPLLADVDALRAKADKDGFLFFRALVPAAPLLELRRDMVSVLDRYGWIKPGSDPMDGLLHQPALDAVPDSEMRPDIGVTAAMYDEIQRLQSFHATPHHPNLVGVMRQLLGEEILVHPRHIARMISSHRTIAPTPEHQDFIHVQGTAETWTCWLPLSDCPRAMGGLTVLRGSNHQGVIELEPREGAGGKGVQLCPNETDWVEGDYQLGDALFFSSLTVHRALPSQMRDRIRLSLDVSYQSENADIDKYSLLPHCSLTWEEVYADWPTPEFQYFWRDKSLNLSVWQDQLRWQRQRICS